MTVDYQQSGSILGFGSKQLAEANNNLSRAIRSTPINLRELYRGGVRHDHLGYNWYWQLI